MRSSARHPQSFLPPPDHTYDRDRGVITLEQIRPHPRPQNEYVDSPRTHPLSVSVKTVVSGVGSGGGGVATTPRNQTNRLALPSRIRGPPSLQAEIISTQPSNQPPVSPLKKDLVAEIELGDGHADSIICSRCGKCRCGACTDNRELPSRWCCGDEVNISPDSAVEYCTCFCCVQCLFYHCGKNYEQDSDYSCYTDPGACCDRPHCCKRWTCIALMSLCLPCLCLYWPAKGAIKACTACYNKCRRKGCQCASTKKASGTDSNSSQSQSRRLLIESDSSSA